MKSVCDSLMNVRPQKILKRKALLILTDRLRFIYQLLVRTFFHDDGCAGNRWLMNLNNYNFPKSKIKQLENKMSRKHGLIADEVINIFVCKPDGH